jgi:hypothetical protein
MPRQHSSPTKCFNSWAIRALKRQRTIIEASASHQDATTSAWSAHWPTGQSLLYEAPPPSPPYKRQTRSILHWPADWPCQPPHHTERQSPRLASHSEGRATVKIQTSASLWPIREHEDRLYTPKARSRAKYVRFSQHALHPEARERRARPAANSSPLKPPRSKRLGHRRGRISPVVRTARAAHEVTGEVEKDQSRHPPSSREIDMMGWKWTTISNLRTIRNCGAVLGIIGMLGGYCFVRSTSGERSSIAR